MSSRFLANALLAVSLAALPIAAAADDSQVSGSSRSTAASPQITFRTCNKTTTDVMIGVSYMVVGTDTWRNKGWTPVSAGDCQDIFVTTNKTWYARAEVKGDSSQYWGTDIKQCVEYPGPYDFNTTSESTTCPEGEAAVFTTFQSDSRPVYVWNLNP